MSDKPENWIQAADITMTFGGVRALEGIEIGLSVGTRLGLIGPNGSGKTTLLNVLSGVYRATAGSILVDGRQIVGAGPAKRARIGIVRTFQHPQLAPSLTIRENVMLGAGLAAGRAGRTLRRFGTSGVDSALDMFRCSKFGNRLPDEVPYGIRKMAEVARAAAANPRLLLLDEPAAGLSGDERVELVSALEEFAAAHPSTSICLVEHDVPLVARLCPEVLVLNAGQMLSHGSTATVLQDARVREAYLGTSQNNSSMAQASDRSPSGTETVDARA